jgi:two-component system, NarL family, response regulator DevR
VSSRINVFLLADSRLFREALSRILRSKSDLSVVGCESGSAEAVARIEGSACDVILIDSGSGEPFDVALLRRVSLAAPTARTILINMVEDEAIFLRAVRERVAGYLLQHASAMDVVAAVRAAHAGEAVCPPRLCLALFKHIAGAADGLAYPGARSPRLTRREQQLVPLIGQGLTNKEIASRLNLSEKTVKNHVHRILQRMGVMNRLAAAEMARGQNLLQP